MSCSGVSYSGLHIGKRTQLSSDLKVTPPETSQVITRTKDMNTHLIILHKTITAELEIKPGTF
jgi:hypothetical protein